MILPAVKAVKCNSVTGILQNLAIQLKMSYQGNVLKSCSSLAERLVLESYGRIDIHCF